MLSMIGVAVSVREGCINGAIITWLKKPNSSIKTTIAPIDKPKIADCRWCLQVSLLGACLGFAIMVLGRLFTALSFMWSDGIIIGGDLTHNSETAILLERYIEKSTNTLTLVCDAIDIITDIPSTIFDRHNLIVAMDIKQLQKLLMAMRFPMPVKSTMTLRQLVGLLHSLTLSYGFSIVTTHENQVYVALNGTVSTTPIKTASIESVAAYVTVWNIHHPNKPLKAMTTGLYDLSKQIT